MKKLLLLVSIMFCAIAHAQSFHDTQGKLEVSNGGQAVYTLPIAMPSSIKDVGPVINLVYASGQSGGIAGQGWNISSISAIARMNTRIDIDGFRDGVDFDDNDKLSLDGQRLLLATGLMGNYWADGAVYETEVHSNTKIELKGTGANIYFIVTSPDGSKSWYGNYGGMDGTDTTAFYIVRFEDTNGNFMTYHYSKPLGKSLCVSEIRFSANLTTNPTPLNKIVFTYEVATRKEYAYIKGIKLEKAEILKTIEVFTNGLKFKKYVLTHTTDDMGYQRVQQLQEFNSANEPANPVTFIYQTTSNSVAENTTLYTDPLNLLTPPDATGDYDGDGRLDFIAGGRMFTKLFQGYGVTDPLIVGGNKRQMFNATTINNSKVNQKQSLVYANETLTQIQFNVQNLEIAGVQNTYIKTIDNDNAIRCIDNCTIIVDDPNAKNNYASLASNCSTSRIKNSNKYYEGDFNGDGISEALIYTYYQEDSYNLVNNPIVNFLENATNVPPPNGLNCLYSTYTSPSPSKIVLFDLNPTTPTTENTVGNFTIPNFPILSGENVYIMDMNSDGKSDVFVLNNDKTYRVISFKQLPTAPWAELEVIGQGILDDYTTTKPILFGDYNGDGKPDIMIPATDGKCYPRTFPNVIVCPNSNLWNIYYSNPNPAGGVYFAKEQIRAADYFTYDAFTSYPMPNYSYYAMDVNKDGKSDIVRVFTNLYQYDEFFDPKDIDSQWQTTAYINNIGLNNTFTLYHQSGTHNNNDNSRPIPLVSNYKYAGLDSDLLMIRYHPNIQSFTRSVTYIDFARDFARENLLDQVTQSGGAIVDNIWYKPMTPADNTNGFGLLYDFYSSAEELQYPLLELKKIDANMLVEKVRNSSLGVYKYQDFKYHGFAIHLGGLGAIGFKKTARSSWYVNDNDKRIWSVTENNPLQRGATIRNYNQLLNNNGFCFLTTYSTGLLNKTESSFVENVNPISKQYSILLSAQTTTDYLTNIVKQQIYNQYSTPHLLPLSVTSNNLLGSVLHSSTTTTTDYWTPSLGTGSNYHIGRPKEVNTTTTVSVNTPTGSPDSKTSKEKFTYTNGNLTKTEKNANNDSVSKVEDYAYFSNGLLLSKTMSATGTPAAVALTPRSTSYTYDPTNRFVKTTTDVEGLVTTNLTYHPVYGIVLTQQNPLGQVTTSTIDNWGKQTKVTDFLGKSINYSYTRTAANVYTTTQTGDDGSSSFTDSDALAKVIRKGSKNFNGDWVYAVSEYDTLGKKVRDSEPYFSTATPTQWTNYYFDEYNRPTQTVSPTGKTVTTTYNGLTISAFDSVITKTKTMNANGQAVLATDTPGGNIIFKYDAMGNLIESDYDGIALKMEYDNWGRKTKLTDTSAGIYTYSYNAFGEPMTEQTPKGITTYTYTPVGKVLTKTVMGLTLADGTSITSTYAYDPIKKWLNRMDVVNPNDGNSSYLYGYDTTSTNPTYQLNTTTENLFPIGSTTPFATFTKNIAFDNFGRVSNEISTATSHGKSSTKTITHVYKNGAEWRLIDGSTVLWQANSVNARGQLLTGTLGNGIKINNSYDVYGYNTQAKHDLGTTNVMTLNNVFEPILGNLTSRYNSMFDNYQSFAYDSLDRLISWQGGLPEVLQEITFPTTTDGFVYNGDTGGSVSNFSQQLKIDARGLSAGATKTIVSNSLIGKVLDVKFDYVFVSGPSGVYAKITECNPSTGLVINTTTYPEIIGSNFKTQYIVQNNNVNIKLSFYIGNALMRMANQNLAAPPSGTYAAVFYIDNVVVTTPKTQTQNYDDRGRITANNLGTYNYNKAGKPYQNSSVFTTAEANAYYTSKPKQTINYNSFKAPINIIEQGVETISYGYNASQQRNICYFGSTAIDKMARPFRRYYSADGSMEVKATFAAGNTTTPTAVEIMTYIAGTAYSAAIVNRTTFDAVTPAGTNGLFYLHRDYQGSILAISNSVGAVVEKRLFDPWGAIAKIQNGAGVALTKMQFFDRGYTGHEHILYSTTGGAGLINMNARLYDPKLHRFLQPDNFVQEPYNTQNYNRYSYCINNPLKYTDISGNVFDPVSALIIGAVVGLTGYLVANLINGTPITLKGALSATFIGAFSGAVTFGIGEAFQGMKFALKATYSALAHSTFQGLMSGIQGGGFYAGFAAGALSSIAGSYMNKLGGSGSYESGNYNFDGSCQVRNFGMDNQNLMVGLTLTSGAIMGGVGSDLAGGNFWKGAVTGLIVTGLNDLAHKTYNQILTEKMLKKIYDAYPKNNDPNAKDYVSPDVLYQQVGGKLEEWYFSVKGTAKALNNTCAIRLSKALNDAGLTIPKTEGTYSGANDKNYFIAVKSMVKYLISTYGTPVMANSKLSDFRTGIFYQSNCGWNDATGHLDILYNNKVGSHIYGECTRTEYWNK